MNQMTKAIQKDIKSGRGNISPEGLKVLLALKKKLEDNRLKEWDDGDRGCTGGAVCHRRGLAKSSTPSTINIKRDVKP